MIRFKLYLDKDKETEWLNEMAVRGYAMKGYFAGFYQFEQCEPGEYIYQIDMNEGLFKVSEDYKNFMEGLGIEITALWGFWVILRKKAAGGEFQLYTDNESKIKNYTKIRNMFKVAAIMELICFYIEVFAAAQGVAAGWIGMIIIGLIMCSCARMALKTNQMIMKLKNEDAAKSERNKRAVSGYVLSGMALNSCALIMQDSVNRYITLGVQIAAIVLMVVGLYRMAHGMEN